MQAQFTGVSKMLKEEISVIDLFCGAGGLSHGFKRAGMPVVLGVDLDSECQYPFEINNDAKFLCKSVADIGYKDLDEYWANSKVRVLAGCAPCQPFSTYSQGERGTNDDKWSLLKHFLRLVQESTPEIVSMENVPNLARHSVFVEFEEGLKKLGYEVTWKVVYGPDYGLPQTRKRLLLVASKFGKVEFPNPVYEQDTYRTVMDAIGGLSKLKAGGQSLDDPLHTCSTLSPLNMQRMKASSPGGTWRDWPDELVAECHKRGMGQRYPSVYGRMTWGNPSPTITTQFFGFGNGRFGHPEQDRALSLREGAILQSFPDDYQFVKPNDPIKIKTIGRLIGNAVPVILGEVVAEAIKGHLAREDAIKSPGMR